MDYSFIELKKFAKPSSKKLMDCELGDVDLTAVKEYYAHFGSRQFEDYELDKMLAIASDYTDKIGVIAVLDQETMKWELLEQEIVPGTSFPVIMNAEVVSLAQAMHYRDEHMATEDGQVFFVHHQDKGGAFAILNPEKNIFWTEEDEAQLAIQKPPQVIVIRDMAGA